MADDAMQQAMREFWDERARENPYFFVDNRLDYRHPDLERFWEGGQEALDAMLGVLDLGIRPTDLVVEIGCGVGRITRAIAERAAYVRAIDVSERMLDTARELNPGLENVEWIHGDGRSLAGIETGSVDVCHSAVVFQHIPDPAITLGYIREIGRVLKPDGFAFFQISNDPSLHVKRPVSLRIRYSLLSLIGRAPRGQWHPAWLGSAVQLADLVDAAGEGGMVVERAVGEGTPMCLVLLRKHQA
jgi:SAM-dependent methyltransferase